MAHISIVYIPFLFPGSSYVAAPDGSRTPVSFKCLNVAHVLQYYFFYGALYTVQQSYVSFEPGQANLCLRAFRHDKF